MKNTVIYLHFYNDRKVVEAKIENEATVGSLIKQYAPKEASNPDSEEDLEVYIQNQDDDLPKGVSIGKLKIKDGDHLHFSRCRKVAVTIIYAGKSYNHNFPPSKTIGEVKKNALHHFHISDEDGARLCLFVDTSNDEPIPINEHVGSFT